MRPCSGSSLPYQSQGACHAANQAAGRRGGHPTTGILCGQELMDAALHPQGGWRAVTDRARAAGQPVDPPEATQGCRKRRPTGVQELLVRLTCSLGNQHRQKTRVCRQPRPEHHEAKKLGSGARPEGWSRSWPRTSPIPQGLARWHPSSPAEQTLTAKASTV